MAFEVRDSGDFLLDLLNQKLIEDQLLLLGELGIRYSNENIQYFYRIRYLDNLFQKCSDLDLNQYFYDYFSSFQSKCNGERVEEVFEGTENDIKFSYLAIFLSDEEIENLYYKHLYNYGEDAPFQPIDDESVHWSPVKTMKILERWMFGEDIRNKFDYNGLIKLFIKKFNSIEQRKLACLDAKLNERCELNKFITDLKNKYTSAYYDLPILTNKHPKTKKKAYQIQTEILWKIQKNDFNKNNELEIWSNFQSLINNYEHFITKKTGRVLMEGQIGSGKSLYVHYMMNMWAKGTVLKDIDLCLYFDFSRIDSNQTLERLFIQQTFPEFSREQQDFYSTLLQRFIRKSPSKVLLLFDQLDHYYFNNHQLNEILEEKSRTPIITWCRNVKAKDIKDTYHCVIELLGFNLLQFTIYLQKCFNELEIIDIESSYEHFKNSFGLAKLSKEYLRSLTDEVEQFQLFRCSCLSTLQNLSIIVFKQIPQSLEHQFGRYDLMEERNSPLFMALTSLYCLREEEDDNCRFKTDFGLYQYYIQSSSTRFKEILENKVGRLLINDLNGIDLNFNDNLSIEVIKEFCSYTNNLVYYSQVFNTRTNTERIVIEFLHPTVKEYLLALYITQIFQKDNQSFNILIADGYKFHNLSKMWKIFQYIGGIDEECLKVILYNIEKEFFEGVNNVHEETFNRFNTLVKGSLCRINDEIWKRFFYSILNYTAKINLKSILSSFNSTFNDIILRIPTDVQLYFNDQEDELIFDGIGNLLIQTGGLNNHQLELLMKCKHLKCIKIIDVQVDNVALYELKENSLKTLEKLVIGQTIIDWKILSSVDGDLLLSDLHLCKLLLTDNTMNFISKAIHLQHLTIHPSSDYTQNALTIELLYTLATVNTSLKSLSLFGLDVESQHHLYDNFFFSMQSFKELVDCHFTLVDLGCVADEFFKALSLGPRNTLRSLILNRCRLRPKDEKEIEIYIKRFVNLQFFSTSNALSFDKQYKADDSPVTSIDDGEVFLQVGIGRQHSQTPKVDNTLQCIEVEDVIKEQSTIDLSSIDCLMNSSQSKSLLGDCSDSNVDNIILPPQPPPPPSTSLTPSSPVASCSFPNSTVSIYLSEIIENFEIEKTAENLNEICNLDRLQPVPVMKLFPILEDFLKYFQPVFVLHFSEDDENSMVCEFLLDILYSLAKVKEELRETIVDLFNKLNETENIDTSLKNYLKNTLEDMNTGFLIKEMFLEQFHQILKIQNNKVLYEFLKDNLSLLDFQRNRDKSMVAAFSKGFHILIQNERDRDSMMPSLLIFFI
ncbi:DgyrCDS844 [Dimorphilus gyrociliatus]|uniref:DgyrCDS844 n=1 Tax=Dimorphilus gyrociliatus TaxID=2664684 RepID=A0A7I8V8L2_9ANNE|nr:DgyrCDS844 [Dimorphilus gyrociliatus]